MRVRFKKSDLVPATAIVQSVANPQSTLPILSNVYITTEHDNVVTMFATDYETRVKIEVPAEVSKKGAITVPAKMFNDLVKELPEDAEIHLEAREKSAALNCGGIRAELQCLPARDYPMPQELDPTMTFDLGQRELKTLIERVLFAVPTRDPRKVLMGALFEFRDGLLQAVATDGKILAFASQSVQSEFAPKDMSVIVHHKLLEELVKTLGDEGNVTVSFDDTQVAFRANNILLITNQIEGKYPNYEAVVPKRFARELRFRKAPMLAATRRASILSDIKNSSVSMHFHGETVSVEAESFDKGTISEEFPAVVEGDDFRIVFNYRFVQEALKIIREEEVVLQVNQPAMPAVFRGADADDYYYLIMPIKTQDLRDEPARQPEPDAVDDEPYDGGSEEQ